MDGKQKPKLIDFLYQKLADIWPSVYRATDTVFWSLVKGIKDFFSLAIKQIMGKYD